MNANMRRGGRRHYAKLGKLGAGKPKTFEDLERAKEQRRAAGIASGKARAAKAKRKPGKRSQRGADLASISEQIKRLNESTNRVV
jgi:hypothetical protein